MVDDIDQRATAVWRVAQIEGNVEPAIADMQVATVVAALQRDIVREPEIVDYKWPGCSAFLIVFTGVVGCVLEQRVVRQSI